MDLSLQLMPDGEAPAECRKALESALSGSLPADIVFDVKLLGSELVTNSLQHAGLTPRDRIELRMHSSSSGVRVSVRDPGPGFEQKLRSLGMEGTAGLGLALLTRLADRWGVATGRYCEVWFELDLDRSRAARGRVPGHGSRRPASASPP